MASSIPLEVAGTVQAGHINRRPDPRRDLNPSTAADRRVPATIRPGHALSSSSSIDDSEDYQHDGRRLHYGEEGDDVPLSALRPAEPAAGGGLYPIPDLRFEQSYLHSIEGAGSWWRVGWITIWHQVAMPLLQGVMYNLVLAGWTHWNKNAQTHGTAVGARVRRWWYRVNRWAVIPGQPGQRDGRGKTAI